MKPSVRFSRVIERAIAYSMLLVLPSCAIPNLRQAAPTPDLPPVFNGAVGPESGPPANGPEVVPPPGAIGATSAGPEQPPVSHGCPENSGQLCVAEFFNDPLLLALIDQAMAGNRELMSLNEEVEVAR